LKSVLTISGILRSVNNPEDKAKSAKSYPMERSRGSTVSKKEYTYGILDPDIPASLDLAASSDFTISKILQKIARESFFLYYFFFY